MQRRPFLHLAVGALTAGCLGAGEVTDEPVSGTPDSAATDQTRMAVADREGTLAVERTETFDYVVRLNDLGDDPTGGVTAFSGLTDRERQVVRTAIAEGYETRALPEWLAEFASGTRTVAREGAYYRLEDTFPTYTVTAESVSPDAVAGEIASYEEYVSAVTREHYVATGLMRLARREGVELSYVWPALREFFDAHEAVRYHGELLSVSVAVADSGPPYRLSGKRVPVSEAVGESVWDASEAPESVRRVVREAGRTRGAYGFDRAPAGLLDNLRAHEYVYLDDTFYTTYVEKQGSVPLSMSAAVRDGRLRLVVRNRGDDALALSSGPPRPFGVVRCHPASDPETRHVLWSDAYAESDRVHTAGREVRSVETLALVSELAPGESVAETYSVGDLLPGEYVVSDSLGVEGGQDSTVSYRVVFSVGEQ